MTTAHLDQDIDLDLDDGPPPRYVRPAQPYIRVARTAFAVGVAILAGGLYAINTGHLTAQSKALPLLVAALILCGVIATVFNHRADDADTPAINIDDQED
ncbi:hypothetical protein ACWD69_09300 [Micromonospora chokoriensis]